MILFNPKINFIKFNKYALLLSISLMILSSILILVKGLNLGIDFLGGTRIDFSINKKVEISLVKDTINNFISNKNYSIKEIENLEEGFSSFSIISKTNLQKDLIGEVERNLKQKFTTDLIVKETLSENIGKNVSDDLANDALLSLLIASILILVYITIQTLGKVYDYGDLTSGRSGCAGASSSTRGVIAGGYTGTHFTPSLTVVNTIDYITIASIGNAIDFGDITQSRERFHGCSNGTRGVFAGGKTPTILNTIDYVTIATTGNASDFGDLITVRFEDAGCSDAHGGLG